MATTVQQLFSGSLSNEGMMEEVNDEDSCP